MLQQIHAIIPKECIGLYRDDGLGVLRNANGHDSDKIRKKLIQLFKTNGLSIEIKCNLKTVDFLDITFDLNNGIYKPYNKPNNDPLYINTESNHPPQIIKQIPQSISKRISTNSATEEIFNEAAPQYNNILERCGYTENLKYEKSNPHTQRKRNRTRDIIWFNPPFSKNVKTKVAEHFLKLLDKHFGKNSKLNKIFNRNKVKVSYSCMSNMAQIIKSHNTNVGSPPVENERTCSCRDKQTCPLNGECLATNIVYRAEIVANNDQQRSKTYIGITAPTFKERLYNHNKSFNNRAYEKDTELSKHIWELKDKQTPYELKWSILRKTSGYSNISKTCSLCTSEKLAIVNFKDKTRLLNTRNELISKCRHQNRFILKNFKPPNG